MAAAIWAGVVLLVGLAVLILYNALTDREDDLPMIADDTPIVSNKTNGEQRKGD